MKLTNRVVFITGASRGVGREVALACAREGADIVVAAKTSDQPIEPPRVGFRDIPAISKS
jgi:NAD(P)-dependent dehydrogenase (short-subunit alcohol dehydrogenase family)